MGGCGFGDDKTDEVMTGGVAALVLCEGESLVVVETDDGLFRNEDVRLTPPTTDKEEEEEEEEVDEAPGVTGRPGKGEESLRL